MMNDTTVFGIVGGAAFALTMAIGVFGGTYSIDQGERGIILRGGTIRARGAALRDNPALVDLVAAERWDGALPQTMLPGSALPFLNVGQRQ